MKNQSPKKRLLLFIFNLALSIVIFVVTYFIDPLKYAENSSLAAIPAFLLSVIVLIIGQAINTYSEVEKVAKNSDLICETVKNYLHVTKMGTPKHAWEYIINRLPIIEYVQNTSFNLKDENFRSDERLYTSEIYKQSYDVIAKYINQGLVWKDVGDSFAINRFRSLNNLVDVKSKGHYEYRLIAHSEPQIGFIILTYKDGTIEVLFNWDFRDIPQDPIVLLSRDVEIINLFAAQYNGLWKISVMDYDNVATKSTS